METLTVELLVIAKTQKQSNGFFCFVLFVCLLSFLGPHPRHMEVPRLGVESEP